MKIIKFIICISVSYFLIYVTCIALGLTALLMQFYTADAFIKLLGLIGSFLSLFFSILFNFFQKIKTANLSNVTHTFHKLYVWYSFILIGLFGSAIVLGVTLDIFNIGFTHDYQFDLYFLLVQSSLGLYTGNLVNDIFKELEDINIENRNNNNTP